MKSIFKLIDKVIEEGLANIVANFYEEKIVNNIHRLLRKAECYYYKMRSKYLKD